jgi:penicillin G amidase
MLMRNVLRVVNALLLMAALVLAVGAWWLVGRAAPKVSGEISAPVAAAVTIERDAIGLPHITASSVEDALFAQGFVTAQDRLWQMDMIRRLAAGEISEVVGAAAVESDTTARKFRMRAIAEHQARTLPPAHMAALAAYARGVNHYIDQHEGKWGPEFALLRYRPRPWTPVDTLLCALQMDRTLTNSWETDLLRARLFAAGDRDKVRRLFPTRSGGEIIPGSNAWALASDRTASGAPILAGDPHLEFTLPSPWHLVHLRAPDLNVIGATLPGLPFVLIGHNEHAAWSITSLQFDTMDLYAEQMDLRTGRYRYQDQILDAARETELIAIKGGGRSEVVNLVTRHGPIFTALDRTHYALRWAAADPAPYTFPLLDLARARNWTEFRAALAEYQGPGINIIFAARDGDIGHQVAGRLPRRTAFLGDLPLQGHTTQYEWDGFIPFDELPSYHNPAGGALVSANQNPFREDTRYAVSGFFAPPDRQRQIAARLRTRPTGWKPEEMLWIQTDVYSAFAHFIARTALAALAARDPGEPWATDARRLFDGWNGQMHKSMAAPVLADLLYQQVRRRLAESAAGDAGVDYRYETAPAAVEALLRERPPGWFEDWDQMVVEALAEAHAEADRRFGRDAAKWRWGRMNQVTLAHPILGRIWLAGAWFNVGPLELNGSSTTVKQTTPRLGPSMRFVADLADWDNSLINLPTGNSGHFTSGHYKDQWDEYAAGKAFRLEFERIEPKAKLQLTPAKAR